MNNWFKLSLYVIKKHVPIERMRVSDRYCPWINAEVRALIKSRDSLKLAACKGKSTLLVISYRQIRNKVNSLNAKLKRQYFITKVSKFEGNLKKTWKTIKQLLHKRSNPPVKVFYETKICLFPIREKCPNLLNNLYSIGKDSASNIEGGSNLLLCDYFLNSNIAKFNIKSIQVQKI